MVFLYFEKAFNSISCIMLWKILRHYGIPAKANMEIMIHFLMDPGGGGYSL